MAGNVNPREEAVSPTAVTVSNFLLGLPVLFLKLLYIPNLCSCYQQAQNGTFLCSLTKANYIMHTVGKYNMIRKLKGDQEKVPTIF